MAKAEWGTKRSCPDCGERFYDLGKEDPVVCINCAHEWVPEPILKTKQPLVLEEKVEEKPKAEKAEGNDDLNETDVESDDDIELDDDDLLGDVSFDDEEDEEVSGMLDTSLADDDM